MPGLDANGPQGLGPMTGRGLGRCAGSKGLSTGLGRRQGAPMGYGRGLARRCGARWAGASHAQAIADEKTMLEDQVLMLEDRVTVIKQRLEEIETSDK